MQLLTLARNAMATRFEIVLAGVNPVALRAAGEEALTEIERLEGQLSLFRPSSEIAHLNARAAHEPIRVSPAVFGLLQQAQKLHAETRGAFDITIGPLVRCWGFMGGSGHRPNPEDLAFARSRVGMHLVQLEPGDFTVRFGREGMMLDLGALGKGYAIDCAVEILRDAGVDNALIHGGTSTIGALGLMPDGQPWKIGLDHPGGATHSGRLRIPGAYRRLGYHAPSPDGLDEEEEANAPWLTIELRDEAVSISAIWGKYFDEGGVTRGHIIDPRTGEPAHEGILAAVALPSATETDALSTALLTLGLEGHSLFADLRAGMRSLVVAEAQGQLVARAHGLALP